MCVLQSIVPYKTMNSRKSTYKLPSQKQKKTEYSEPNQRFEIEEKMVPRKLLSPHPIALSAYELDSGTHRREHFKSMMKKKEPKKDTHDTHTKRIQSVRTTTNTPN